MSRIRTSSGLSVLPSSSILTAIHSPWSFCISWAAGLLHPAANTPANATSQIRRMVMPRPSPLMMAPVLLCLAAEQPMLLVPAAGYIRDQIENLLACQLVEQALGHDRDRRIGPRL